MIACVLLSVIIQVAFYSAGSLPADANGVRPNTVTSVIDKCIRFTGKDRWICGYGNQTRSRKKKGPVGLHTDFRRRTLPANITCIERPDHPLALFPDHHWAIPVTVINESAVFLDASGSDARFTLAGSAPASQQDREHALASLLDENLEVDIHWWRRGGPYRTQQIMDAAKVLLEARRNSRLLVLVMSRQLYAPSLVDGKVVSLAKGHTKLAHPTLQRLARLVQQGHLPDSLFMLNIGDSAVCTPWQYPHGAPPPAGYTPHPDGSFSPCAVPVLSVQKAWGPVKERDVVIPQLGNEVLSPFFNFPWKYKINAAAWRGSTFCHSRMWPLLRAGKSTSAERACSRIHLSNLSFYQTLTRGSDSRCWLPKPNVAASSQGSASSELKQVLEERSLMSTHTGNSNRVRIQRQRQDSEAGSRQESSAFRHERNLSDSKHHLRKQLASTAGVLPPPVLFVGLVNRLAASNVVDNVGAVQRRMELIEQNGTQGFEGEVEGVDYLPGMGAMPLSELARFRYMLHLDGITASTRMGKLMHINSAIIKQASLWVEYFSRSLVEGQHYMGFWRTDHDDVLQLLSDLQSPARHQPLQLIAQEANVFAARYLTAAARRMYWTETIKRYNALFPDIDAYIKTHFAHLAATPGS